MDASERQELEAALGSPDKFLSDEQDAMAWWLLFGLAAAGGIIAFLYDRATDPYSGGLRGLIPFASGVPNPLFFITHPQVLAFYVALGVLAWVVYTFVTNHKRRGLAITSYGLLRIRGRKVQLFRYQDIDSATQRSLGARGKRFTILTVKEKDGQQYELYCHGSWAAAAAEKINAPQLS